MSRIEQSERPVGTGGETGSVKSGSSKPARGKAVVKDTVVAGTSKKDKSKEQTTVAKVNSGSSTSKKLRKAKNVVIADPDVVHKISKPSKR